MSVHHKKISIIINPPESHRLPCPITYTTHVSLCSIGSCQPVHYLFLVLMFVLIVSDPFRFLFIRLSQLDLRLVSVVVLFVVV